jgi:hypothetical protein
MSRLSPERLHVQYRGGATAQGPAVPRCYTLTHSDATGDLFLTVGTEYNRKQISGLYTRLMRDEVLAEWREDDGKPALHVCCHVSGGLAIGLAGWRDAIFRHELPLVLEAFRYGDQKFFDASPNLDEAPVLVHFRSGQRRYRQLEHWGKVSDYRP